MKRIFIIGYMGVGKTTIGQKLGEALNFQFIDIDKYIQNKYRKTVYDLFTEKGESAFREIEQSVLSEVACFEDVVISTGGGTPCFFNNMELMNKMGVTVYLRAKPQELAARLLASKNVRPLVEGKSEEELIPFIKKHLSERKYYYEKANILIETNILVTKEHVHVVVEQIINELKKITK